MFKEGAVAHETSFTGQLRFLKFSDITDVFPIVSTWVRDKVTDTPFYGEINAIQTAMMESLHTDNPRIYIVAQQNEQLVGVMGLRPPEEKLAPFIETPRPLEIINAFVDRKLQGRGTHTGSALLDGLTRVSLVMGSTELILSSGPRYKETGWPFWRSKFGPEIATVDNFFAPGILGKVWRKDVRSV